MKCISLICFEMKRMNEQKNTNEWKIISLKNCSASRSHWIECHTGTALCVFLVYFINCAAVLNEHDGYRKIAHQYHLYLREIEINDVLLKNEFMIFFDTDSYCNEIFSNDMTVLFFCSGMPFLLLWLHSKSRFFCSSLLFLLSILNFIYSFENEKKKNESRIYTRTIIVSTIKGNFTV